LGRENEKGSRKGGLLKGDETADGKSGEEQGDGG
jgi:hypothetical protein